MHESSKVVACSARVIQDTLFSKFPLSSRGYGPDDNSHLQSGSTSASSSMTAISRVNML